MQPSERITFASVPEIQTTCDSHDTKGLSITTHLDSSVLWRPSLHAVPLKMSGRKYLHFLIRLDIQTSRRFYQRVKHKQRQRANFYCHLIPWNRLELCTTVSIKPLIKNRRSFFRFRHCTEASWLAVATVLNKYPYPLTSVDYISKFIDGEDINEQTRIKSLK